MKNIIYAIVLIGLISCTQIEKTSTDDSNKTIEKITFSKDYKTGLCFATINSVTYLGHEVISITCVPCDSLKKIGIK